MIPEKTFIVLLAAFLRNMILPMILGIMLGLVLGLNGIWIGFALAPAVTFGLCIWIMKRIYGRKSFPLYIEEGDLTDYSFILTPENIIAIAMRDEGEIFDITDTDSYITSFRSYIVANVMAAHKGRRNLTTTSFNRNGFYIPL